MGPLIPAIFAAAASVSTSSLSAGATATIAADATATTAAATTAAATTSAADREPAYEARDADEPLLDEESPLTADELALIGSLTSETSSTGGTGRVGPRFWLAPAPLSRPTLIVPRSQIRETIARSVAEAFEPHPTIVDTARRYVPGDSASIRGQSGHRVALYMDGIPLHHALTPSRETPGFFTIDPWMIAEAVLERPGSLVLSPRGTAGAIRLAAIAPRSAPGIDAEGELAARSADRSTSTHVAASVARGVGAIRLAAGYSDYRALRIAGSNDAHGAGYQRAAINTRARLFGQSGDPFEVYGGVDFDRLLNVARTDLPQPPLAVDRLNQRLMVFARANVGTELLGGSVLVARQTFLRKMGIADDHATTDEEADSWFLRASGELRLFDVLTLRAGGIFETSDATTKPSNGSTMRLGDTVLADGFAAVDLATETIRGSAQLVLVHASSTPDVGPESSSTRPLSQGGVRFSIFGPLGVRAGWTEGLYVPTIQDLRDAMRPLPPERTLAFDFGPSFYAHEGWFEALGFYTIVHDAIEPVSLASRQLVSIPDVRIVGVELTTGLYLLDGLRFAGSLTWSEGQDTSTGAPVVTFPSITGRASLRYDFGVRNAYLETHVRASSDPIYLTSIEGAAPPASLAGLAPTSFARVGVAGATDLALGFRVGIVLENVLDTAHRASASLVPGAGVDVRVALSYTLP